MLGHASVVSIPKNFSMTEYIHHLFEFSAEESVANVFQDGRDLTEEMFDQVKKTSKIPQNYLMNY